jgi:hypothetical protein
LCTGNRFSVLIPHSDIHNKKVSARDAAGDPP